MPPDAPQRSSAGRVVRAYFWSRLQQRRFLRLQGALFTGFWLGVMSSAELETVDDAFYVGDRAVRGSPIDYTQAEYNRRGLFAWERRAVDAHFRGRETVLLMAAGGGREVLALVRDGFRVHAWECQPSFASAANEMLVADGFEPAVVCVPRNEVPSRVDRADGAIVGWGAYSLISSRDRRVAVLRALRDQLEPGAPLLLSFLTRRPADRQFAVIAGVANAIRRLLRREHVEVGDVLQPNLLHLFVEDEVADELAAGGFRMQWSEREPYGHAFAVAAGG